MQLFGQWPVSWAFSVAFFAALHISYFSKVRAGGFWGALTRTSLSVKKLRQASLASAVVVVGKLALPVALISYRHFADSSLEVAGFECQAALYRVGGAVEIALWTIAIAWSCAFTYKIHSRFRLHFHHYFAGAVLVLLSAAGTSASCACADCLAVAREYAFFTAAISGIGLGLFVEGAARWSCAPMWHGEWGQSERTFPDDTRQ